MLVGTGIDIVEIERIAQSIARYGDRFLEKIFTPAEIEYCRRKKNFAESFAARFAAKEAGAKALGTGIQHGIAWKELEVRRLPGHRPTLHLTGRALELCQPHRSGPCITFLRSLTRRRWPWPRFNLENNG